ncbi:MAG: ferredoxin--NADP reductase [Candidatus Micrarchaeaceae archaeon]
METIPITERKYELAERIDETPEVLIIKLMPDDNLHVRFDPGMFMMITGVDTAGKRYTARAYSIASDPSTQGMEFTVIKEPKHGEHIGTSHFVEANIGDIFMLKGPNGQFRFDPKVNRKVMFIAGGTGLAPFISMLRHIKVTGSSSDVVLLYSVKYPTEVIRKDELSGYADSIGIRLVVTVTRPQPGDGWSGQTGHADKDMIAKYAPDFKERTMYICGPLEFVKAVKDALAALGVQPDMVKADVWG